MDPLPKFTIFQLLPLTFAHTSVTRVRGVAASMGHAEPLKVQNT